MKLLIVGELASVGNYLAKGFTELGVDIHHIAHSHSWRKDSIQHNLTSQSNFRVIRGVYRYLNPLMLDNISGYDGVIFLDRNTFATTKFINKITNKKIQDNNGPSYYWILGCDSKMRQWSRVNSFALCNSCLLYDQKSIKCQDEKNVLDEDVFLNGITAIIPGAYEYNESYINHPKKVRPIQMPMEIQNSIPPFESRNDIKILHGLNRYGFKGTQIVEYVFNQLKSTRKNELFISDRLPLTAWKDLMSTYDVIVDQLFNKSLGMNSLFALASGKLLVAGDVSLAATMFEIPVPPMVSTEPSIEGLTRSLEAILDSSFDLKRYSEEAIEYIRAHHLPRLIASKFIGVFGW